MKVKVPKNVDVKKIVANLDVSPTIKKNIKEKIYIFLSRILIANENSYMLEKNDGYINLSSAWLKKMFGGKLFYDTIRPLLTDEQDPIIELNRSWWNSTNIKKSKNQGYRITSKYQNGETTWKTISEKNSKKYIKEAEDKKNLYAEYDFLLNQFDVNKMKLDDQIFDYLISFCKELNNRVVNGNEFQKTMMYSVIGRWIYFIDQINNNEIWKNISVNNKRLNSSITILKKTLRNFLVTGANEKLFQIDISASQPYLLASIMTRDFMKGIEPDGFNIQNIYPELHDKLKDYIESNLELENEYFSSKSEKGKNRIKQLLEEKRLKGDLKGLSNNEKKINIINYYAIKDRKEYDVILEDSILYMWCKKFSKSDIESIVNYRQAPFEIDFYMHVVKTHLQQNSIVFSEEELPLIREKFKSTLMYVLFDENEFHRNNNENILTFSHVYPGVDKWIEGILQLSSKKEFAYLMQRTESYLILKVICKEFLNKFPNAPLYTIHDAIWTTEEYITNLEAFVKTRLEAITGIKPGLKTTGAEMPLKPSEDEINEVWRDIKKINTSKKFEAANHKIFDSNIERGRLFFEQNGLLK
ncbi:MAG: hypothetical protein ACERKD_05930 [Prolixibacteraceae bacterium]